ncbi:YraN family protein [Mucilaginibacter sp. PPCGB 2223]|uniref:YraN family protein n=1 Tax=Mucilaginibacter sp. PPCGB 2223 TaxID=1886027 RepID=UPI000824EA9E|nr:YraN family protein [Mucilaginibacter sp. PPCGB 2223]OCX50354.1 YraN family protein [Mucilaginibacter sp. PPCGB 2223]
MANHLDLGRLGEQLAKTYLEGLGYEIIDENWTHGKAEVDLIAYHDKTIIFVEVKTRTGTGFGQPEDFVDARKQKLLADAANEYIYLMEHNGDARFDIVSVLFDQQNKHTLKHIPDAFWPAPDI